MVDELKVDDKKRHSSFHNNDNLISVDDLWNTWQRSEGIKHFYEGLLPMLLVFIQTKACCRSSISLTSHIVILYTPYQNVPIRIC